ncbi:hypothetical protein [Sinorhizobium meliloti]|uniref:hypothetical protein n=1 Tax=Rhizobium meliloti TaxID=382 RepID=UPI00041DFFE8|nr:hypothetical protein [Sinorhizobium meliloti]MDE3796569.1 hypothetical protein [Sinorhizobium meliloti]MDE4600409.1 hypothetical protein [Sinorhizobium meliloti]QQF05112.1 hypothetical protein JFX10_11215 [Sinorhizobium meliloti]RVH19374.1 hypothetical protein CN216_06855 [Sinorhizobium meliloti]RVJ95988.1 hypothetical protein CN173_13095 [Sinorhizobium meliloti]
MQDIYSYDAKTQQSYVGPIYVDGQTVFGQLDSGSSEHRNTLLNAETALSNLPLYDYATAQSAWPQDYTAAMSFLHEALNDFADVPTGIEAQAFVSQNACLFRSLKTCYIFATFEREANVAAHPRY